MTALDWLNVGLQSVLLGAAGWLVVSFFLRDARHRAWASLLSLAAMVLLPWIPLWQANHAVVDVPVPSAWRPEWNVRVSEPAPAPVVSHGAAKGSKSGTWMTWSFPHWTSSLVWVWGVGSAWMALRHVWRTAAVTRWKQRLPFHDREGLPVRVTPDLASPCLAGVLTPEIVVPEQALEEWSAQQWHWALSHEQEHRRGADPLIAWCLEWMRACLWWNPLVHRFIAGWEQAREEICDRAAVEKAAAAAPYSEFLLSVAVASRSPGMAMAASRSARRLKARLLALMEHRSVRRRPHWSFFLLMSGLSALGVNLVGCVGLKPSTLAKEEGPLMTRSYQVAPEVNSLIRRMVPAYFHEVVPPIRPGGLVSTQQGLQYYGIDFPNGASADFDPAASQLIVRNNARRLEQVETLIDALTEGFESKTVLINIRAKWLEIPSDAPVAADLSLLTEAQFQMVLRSLNQKKGVDLLTSPQVTSFSGQSGWVEISRKQTSRDGADFSGVRTRHTPMIHDGKILLNFVADIGLPFQRGKRMPMLDQSDTKGVVIKHLIRRESVAVGNGGTLAIDMGAPSRGRRIMLFLTASLVDTSGKKLSMEEAMNKRTVGSDVPSGRRGSR